MDNVGCTGTEKNLTECSFSTTHSCEHSEDVGVLCHGQSTRVSVHQGYTILMYRIALFSWGIYLLMSPLLREFIFTKSMSL